MSEFEGYTRHSIGGIEATSDIQKVVHLGYIEAGHAAQLRVRTLVFKLLVLARHVEYNAG